MGEAKSVTGFNITKLSLNRPIALGIIFGIIALAGVVSFSRLNYELVPKFNPPVLTVVTIFPGALAQEVETEVSIPIEDALSGLEGLETITSTSQDNLSLIRLELKSSVDIDQVLDQASRKLLSVNRKLPDFVESPVLSRFDFDDLPMMRIGITAQVTDIPFSDIVRRKIIKPLSQRPGVAEIDLFGASEQVVEIDVLPERLLATNTSILQVLQALKKNNVQLPAGVLATSKNQQPILFKARTSGLQ
ncbi:MAG: efflux RND transporter permease subunit, partial [Bacteroidota bacterium]